MRTDLGLRSRQKDTSFGIAFGYNFHKIVAVEAGYFNMGKLKADGIFSGVPFAVDGKAMIGLPFFERAAPRMKSTCPPMPL